MEERIKELIATRLGDVHHPLFIDRNSSESPPRCRTFVVSKLAGNITAPPAIFRSYSVDGEPRTKCAIWQAARATTAAPTFFKPMEIDNPRPPIRYVDGGLGNNNPSQLALAECRRIWGAEAKVCLVSIGTGHQSATSIVDEARLETNLDTQKSMFKLVESSLSSAASKIPAWRKAANIPPGVLSLLKMTNALTAIATNSEGVHNILQYEAFQKFPYFRFNVERDVGDIGLEEWKKEHALTTNTVAYMRTFEISKRKQECSKCLINPTVFYSK